MAEETGKERSSSGAGGGTKAEEKEYDGIEEVEEDEDDGGEFEPASEESRMRTDKAMVESFFRRMSSEDVPVRVHDVLIKGNTKTKEALIEAEVEFVKSATTLQELIQASGSASARLQQLEIFDAINVTLAPGPPELPGTANVIVEVSETKNPISGNIGAFSKPGSRSWSLEGSLKLKNLFGYGDLWDGSLAYGWDQSSEISAGVYLPRFKRLITPITARAFLLSQDWLKFSSYKERSLGLSLGLLSSKNHELAYNVSLRTLTDPSQMASKTVRRQLGHGLLSVLKYTFRVDRRNSHLRPTQGYAFVSTSQIAGLVPDYRSIRFLRQEFDFRYALPFGFYNAALNFGVSAGAIFPWGTGFMNKPTFLPDRFFLGGNTSPVCSMGGPTSVFGFKLRGLGPSEPRRAVINESSDSSDLDFVGGDLAVTAFADLSFDLPLKILRESGIHGHAFACTGSLNKLSENAFRGLSIQKFRESFKASIGLGVIVPTKLFRMEINYCCILKQGEHDRGKTGLQFSFSSSF
ncbi:unnamed protein product [Cuscuta campestris]|uniref:POTRA domain-containing protein n=1 Tax=Cuscuta campestris TaxID=132261 RepID=A0A484MP60_9ASTE|nr:unnamed protein product [Cuscuta campestris]